MFARLAIVLLALLPNPALAQWHEASSDNFLIVADQNEKDVREFSERLERFHDAVNVALNRKNEKPSPSNRVTIYVVKNPQQVRTLAGVKGDSLRGFYNARAGGSVAFISRVDSGARDVDFSELVLLHEYAHHLMHAGSQWANPRWLSEGFAEFFATARFEKNGNVGVGLPAVHRADELNYALDVPIEALLDEETYDKKKATGYDQFYVRSWALYHYLVVSKNRPGQLAAYMTALADGASPLDAAQQAFGDLKKLSGEMNAYVRKRTWNFYTVNAAALNIGTITVRKLRPAEAAIMPVVLESKRGVDDESAKALLPKAQAIAAQYPDDPAVLAALAEAEHDAGNYAAAVATADKALAKTPNSVNAHVQKIYALERLAQDASDSKPAWTAVRKAAMALNKVENDHPIPLIYYYKSVVATNGAATDLAVQGLGRALDLAPFDKSVRWDFAQQLIDNRAYGLAYRVLMPLANDPHNRGEDNPARALLAEVKSKLDEKPPTATATTPVAAPPKSK